MIPLKGIFFDFGGTLDAPGLSWPERFFPIYRKFLDLSLDFPSFLKAFYDSDDGLAEREKDLPSFDLERTVDRQVFWTLKALETDSEAVRLRITEAFLKPCRASLSKSRSILIDLAREHTLGIVSNFYGNLETILRTEELRSLFSVVVESSKLGTVKPDPRMFQAAVDGARVPKEACLMVGDSLKRDVVGARSFGIQAAWLRPDPAATWVRSLRPEAPEPPEGTLILDRLEGLPEVLSLRLQAVLN